MKTGGVFMDLTMKTIFYCYPDYDEMISSIQNLILHKAMSSYSNSYKTEAQILKITKLISSVDLLRQLKLIVEEILNHLSFAEQELVRMRYFKKAGSKNSEHHTRTYYRNQLRLEKKLEILLGEYGIDEVWFSRNCKDIHFLRERYNIFFKQKEQRRAKLDKINAMCEQLNSSKAA